MNELENDIEEETPLSLGDWLATCDDGYIKDILNHYYYEVYLPSFGPKE